MFSLLRKNWRALTRSPAGKRFQLLHERQKSAPGWVKPALIVGAFISLAVAIVLTVLPGPAIVFYALSGALIAIESAWLARKMDRAELFARRVIARVRRRIRRTSSSS